MPYQQKNDFKQSVRLSTRFLLASLLLLCIVFFAPHARYHDLKTFFAIAKSTDWKNMGDWHAAWCSFKIILFSASVFLMAISIEELLISFKRNKLATWFLLLLIAPILGCWVGFYYLVKSVL
jgi:hypothetical protein